MAAVRVGDLGWFNVAITAARLVAVDAGWVQSRVEGTELARATVPDTAHCDEWVG